MSEYRFVTFDSLESCGMDCYQKHYPAVSLLVNPILSFLVIGFGTLGPAAPCWSDEVSARSSNIENTDGNGVSLIRLEPLDEAAAYPPVVTAMATAAKGKWLAAAGDDHAIRIVQLSDGRISQTLIAHRDWVQSIAILENQNRILSCSQDGELRLWKSQEVWTSQVIHRGDFALMTLTVDGQQRYVACAGFGPSISIYSLSDLSLQKTLSCTSADIRALAFSNNGEQLACGGRDGVVRVWKWKTDDQPLEQALHRDRIRAIRFSADDNELTSIGEDRRLIRYRHDTGQVVSDRVISTGRLLSMTFIDDETIAIAGSDNTIRILDVKTSQEQNKLIGHEGSVAVMNCDGAELISGSFDTTIRIWNLKEAHQSQISRTGRYEHPVSSRFQDSGVSDGVQ
jgi:WD40 repeat protein